jgi:hypothetical protein
MEYSTVTNLQWANPENTMIDCVVFFEHLGEPLPFTANPNDVEAHGREIFSRCVAEEFGPIADYVPPSDEVVAATVKARRDYLLAMSDWTQLPDVPQATKDLWAVYRQALRDITAQAGFPQNVTWPTAPQ